MSSTLYIAKKKLRICPSLDIYTPKVYNGHQTMGILPEWEVIPVKKKVYIGVICVLVLTMCISAFYLIRYAVEGKREADRYAELSAQTTTAPATEATTPATTEPTAPKETYPRNTVILDAYKKLHDDSAEGNSDLVGWIRIDGTVLDYPVMQTSVDNKDYYLYRNFDKKESVRGSIYAREECDIFTPSDNITLYGHNMKDGSMFASLLNYADKDYWQENSLITFDTIYEYHTYKIFAVFKTTATLGKGFTYQKFENAENEADFDNFVNRCRELSFYDTGIIPAYGDKIICLSTCEYTLENGRFVVAAVQIS